MKHVISYPGTFSPPTYGHLHILRKAAGIHPEITVVCSVNPGKDSNWFTPEDAKTLWSAYDLPTGTKVVTLAEYLAANHDPKSILLVRGIRDEADAETEKDVALYNARTFGVEKFTWIMGDREFADVSSTAAREATERLDIARFPNLVAPLVASSLLERELGLSRIILVVGPPAGGKSTFLSLLRDADPERNLTVDTDAFLKGKDVRDAVHAHFGMPAGEVAKARDLELKEFVAPIWMAKMRETLEEVRARRHDRPENARLFLEVPYAMRRGFELYRYLGGRILWVGPDARSDLVRRLRARGTPHLVDFVDRIPDRSATAAIAGALHLAYDAVSTSCSLDALRARAARVSASLNS